MTNETQKHKVAIIVATITVIGTLVTALFNNWNKIFSNQFPPEGDRNEIPNEQNEFKNVEVKFLVYTKKDDPIERVEVQFISNGAPSSRYTDSNGYVMIEIPERNHIQVTLRKEGFKTKRQFLNLKTDPNRPVIVYLDRETSTDPLVGELEKYLQEGEWKKADLETSSLIFKGSDSNASNVSCEDIHKIDQLWLKYSNGRFGFSIQSSIYLETQNPLGRHQQYTWRKFADRVGWRVNGIWLESYDSLNLSLNAPKGHLPVFAGRSSGMRNINAITRAIQCGLG